MNTPIDLHQLIDNELELSSLPDIYNRISKLLNDDNSSYEQITEVIQTDPALTARILKVVNSSFYGFPQQIYTIMQAVGILGHRSLRNIVLGTIVAGMCRRMSNDIFELEAYWEHSVRTGVLTRLLAQRAGQAHEADAVFISGLLHDIGKLIIAHQLPEQARQIQIRVMEEDTWPYQIEMEVLGFDHAELGAEMMRDWGLPDLLVDTVRYHHQPKLASKCQICCHIICLADWLARHESDIDLESVQKKIASIPGQPIAQIDNDFINELMLSADEQFQQVLAMFK